MNKIRIGSLSDIDAKGSRTFQFRDTEIAVFRLSDGSVKAVENRCPHKNGKLSEGMVCGRIVHCPLHDWRISLDDGMVQKPDDGCIPTYETEIDEAGAIYIKL